MTDEIKIDKGVPIPEARRKKPKKYPFADMEIGDSFFAQKNSIGVFGRQINDARKETGFNFSCRTVTEFGVKGIRVWRIK